MCPIHKEIIGSLISMANNRVRVPLQTWISRSQVTPIGFIIQGRSTTCAAHVIERGSDLDAVLFLVSVAMLIKPQLATCAKLFLAHSAQYVFLMLQRN